MAGDPEKEKKQLAATLANCNMNPKDATDFAEFEATLKKIQDILQNNKLDDGDADKDAKAKVDFENLDVDSVKLKVRENRTVINKKTPEEEAENDPTKPKTMNQQSFMEQVERDANERAEARAKREYEAEMQRAQGNEAFRNNKFEKAVLHYTRAIEKIKDSPITYNNRALCFIKLRNFKRALQDCDYVLNKLQNTNLRAWLYQATAQKHLNQAEKFEESVAKAREHNPTQLAYIDKYVKQLEAEESAETGESGGSGETGESGKSGEGQV